MKMALFHSELANLTVLVDSAAHDVMVLVVQTKHGKAIAASYIDYILLLSKVASHRMVHGHQSLFVLEPKPFGSNVRSHSKSPETCHAPGEDLGHWFLRGKLVD